MKTEREDSEGEEMDHDSAESDKSSSSSESSDAGSDTDDSSEMDEEECDRRRAACLDHIATIETQYSHLREQYYRERIVQVDAKLAEIRLGTAKEYLEPVADFQENCRIRIEVGGVLKELRLTNIKNKHAAEAQAAHQNHDSEKSLLLDSIKEDLEDKIRRLEEDRNSVDISAGLWMCERGRDKGSFTGAWNKGNKQHNDSGRRKPVVVSGPYIVYMLSEADILEDWTSIKKALSICKRKSDC
uniref:Breast cancer metastasis-suppressor 1-like protein-A n=1 Tax=Clastoptera arizonana TaxID=38151 RepID=A0A1B6DDC1_9HEMI